MFFLEFSLLLEVEKLRANKFRLFSLYVSIETRRLDLLVLLRSKNLKIVELQLNNFFFICTNLLMLKLSLTLNILIILIFFLLIIFNIFILISDQLPQTQYLGYRLKRLYQLNMRPFPSRLMPVDA